MLPHIYLFILGKPPAVPILLRLGGAAGRAGEPVPAEGGLRPCQRGQGHKGFLREQGAPSGLNVLWFSGFEVFEVFKV